MKWKEILLLLIIMIQERWYANMGGRGTYAIGNNVTYLYNTVGKLEGVKVLKGISVF